jgi:MraZ protein
LGIVFAGAHPFSIDDKGRLAIPARFRAQLEGSNVYITRAHKPSLEIYPAAEFQRLAEQIESMEDRRIADRLKEIFIGHAVETEIDKQGRVLLPQLLRRYAGLEGPVMVVGQIKRFDVWSESEWNKKVSGAPAAENLADAFALLKR